VEDNVIYLPWTLLLPLSIPQNAVDELRRQNTTQITH